VPPLLSFLSALIAALPFADLPVLGALLGFVVGSVLRIRRDHASSAMERARLSDHAPAMFAALFTGVVELFWLAGGEKKDLSRVVRWGDGAEARLAKALGSGRGAVLLASHTGNWELAACRMAEHVPLSVLVKGVSIGVFDRFMRQMRRRYGVGLLEGEGALARARQVLDAGSVVAVLQDQVPLRQEHGEWLPFLGEDALTEGAGALLAAAAGVTLVVTAQRRGEDGRHVLEVLSVKEPPQRGRTEWAREATREASRELEAFVRAYPAQWLWMHRRWKRPRASELMMVPSRAREFSSRRP
jgi:Kdo2-lipid IVA lauroyltransferase/acyltransferase